MYRFRSRGSVSCSLTCLKRSWCTLTAPLSTGDAAAVRSLWQRCWPDDRSVDLVRQLSNMLLTLATCPVPVAAQYRRCVVLLTAQRKLKQREAHALEHQVVRPVAGILGRCRRGRRALSKLVKGGGVLCGVSSAAVHTVSVRERRGECVRVVVWSGLVKRQASSKRRRCLAKPKPNNSPAGRERNLEVDEKPGLHGHPCW